MFKNILMIVIIFLTLLATSLRVTLFDGKKLKEVKRISKEELEKELPAHVVDDIVEQSVKGMGTMLNVAIFGLLFVLFLIAKFL